MYRAGARINLGLYRGRRGGDATGLLSEAISDLDRSIQANPANAEAWWYRGNAHLGMARHLTAPGPELRAALDDYREAVRLNPLLEPCVRDAVADCRRLLQQHGGE